MQALIVTRFKAYTGHSAAFFYSVSGKFAFDGKAISAKLQPPAGAPVDSKKRITDEVFTAGIVQACQQQPALVTFAESLGKTTPPPLPFSLLDLQAQMSQDHGIDAQKTLAITQALRDNHKAISYNRSDCNYLSEEQFNEAPETLAVLASALPDLASTIASVDSERKSRAFDDSKTTAHTAIIPTAVRIDLDNLKADERAVYLAIVKQYVAQFLPDKQFLSAKVLFEVAGSTFVARGKKTTAQGWTALINDTGTAEDGEDGEDGDVVESPFDVLEALTLGASGQCESLAVSKEKTKPLPLYTESTLLKDLRQVSKYVTDPRIKKLLLSRDEGKDKSERGGIGTPATRAEMLAKLQERNYYAVDNKKLIPTKLGLQLHDALPAIATKPDMTALWHEQQQLIEAGKLTLDAFLDELESFIAEQIKAVDLGSLQGFSVTANCPMCGGSMAPNGHVVACSSCEFHVFREICGKELSEEQMHQLLTTARTGVIKGLRSKKEGSKAFDASLKLTAEGTVEFVFPKTKAAAKKRA
ncbi:DNA topoisomerase [Serratia proteamaculans]|uniref:type IA DNA topoisomerase n=1 Tax=Serratia proteamaculans TaxID=28151 RepID=UPI003D005F6B